MFAFGIDGYRPSWSHGRDEVLRQHADRLRNLAGRPLTNAWLVWDVEDDEWFPDCPVVLDFAGERVEINHHKFDDLSLTWNTIDLDRPVDWPGFELAWRPEPLPELRPLRGRTLDRVELLEWTGRDLAQGNVDLSFVFAAGRLTVFNALDENGLTCTPPDPQRQQPHPLH
ncbi:hypothetical protein [Streptomyces sp. Da 82-17]|uniref:hypothetical protein n=1 Tax=Streptomyces sp. Da 82-17 TaxID=3377116 RepID=UPI0038D3D40F